MTTIAFDGKNLVVDRQMTYGSNKYQTCKMAQTPLGLAAVAGDMHAAAAIIHWLQNDDRKPEDYPINLSDEANVVVVTKEKVLKLFTSTSSSHVELSSQRYTEGSGAGLAMGAMLAGKNAIGAVLIASMLDINTGKGYSVGNVIKGTIKHYD